MMTPLDLVILPILCSTLFYIVVIVSAVLLLFKKQLYKDGWSPKTTTPMYLFTIGHGAAKGTFYVLAYYMNENLIDYWTHRGYWPAFSMVYTTSHVLYFCMFVYHLMTWGYVVHPSKTEGTREAFAFWRAIIFIAIALMALVTQTISTVQGFIYGQQSFAFLVSSVIYYMILIIAAVVLTVLYAVFHKKLVLLIRESQLANATKAYRIVKVNRLLVILLITLDLSIPEMIMTILASFDSFLSFKNIPIWLLTLFDAVPNLITDVAVIYYFSPLSVRGDESNNEKSSMYDSLRLQPSVFYVHTSTDPPNSLPHGERAVT